MFRKKFKVIGEDVDDFMVMQKSAYHSYISLSMKYILSRCMSSENSYGALEIDMDMQQTPEFIDIQKNLMFAQQFFLNIELLEVNKKERVISVRNRFFNNDNELCAFGVAKLPWSDQNQQNSLDISKKIISRLVNGSYGID